MRPRHLTALTVLALLPAAVAVTLTGSPSPSPTTSTARPLLFSMTSVRGAIAAPTVTTTTVGPGPTVPPVVSPPSSTVPAAPSVPSTTSPASVSTSAGLDPTVYAEWTRVAVCEEGGWIGYAGPAYPDSLGINARNWAAWGGGDDLSPANQIRVAQDIEAAAGNPGYVPDQYGCASW